MQKINNEKGITLISLVITIILLLILTSISMNYGLSSINSSTDKRIQSELEIVQHVCIAEYTKAKQLNFIVDGSDVIPENFIGEVVSISELPTDVEWTIKEEDVNISRGGSAYKNYFMLTPNDLADLDVFNATYRYIVNYYTGEVFNATKKYSSSGKPLYIKAVSGFQTNVTEDEESFTNW